MLYRNDIFSFQYGLVNAEKTRMLRNVVLIKWSLFAINPKRLARNNSTIVVNAKNSVDKMREMCLPLNAAM